MKTIRRHIKVIAVFLFLNTVNYIFFPIVSMALTDGPATPEAFSFEPVDTSDLVNLQTGDFVYNIPLLEVPGPGGGYPISLSYHAGIQPDQEASWVGLGWNINPGSISRYINNYPDDWANTGSTVRDFWEGGETTYNSFGASYGVADFASVSAGITVANDTHEGSGFGAFVGAGAGISKGAAFGGVSGSVGIMPYSSNVKVSGGLNVGVGATAGNVKGSLSASVGGTIGSKEISYGLSGGISYRANDKGNSTYSLLGASLSSGSANGGASLGLSVAGSSSSQTNSQKGSTSSYSKAGGLSVPVPFVPGLSLNYSREYVRYWSDETTSTANYGAIYNPHDSDYSWFDNVTFDTYDIGDYTQSLGSENDYNAIHDTKGTFMDYDVYNVNAQGVAGTMKPYYYQAHLNRRNSFTEVSGKKYDLINYVKPGHSSMDKPEFRFSDDFSNKLVQGEHTLLPNYLNSSSNVPNMSFDGSLTFFEEELTDSGLKSYPGSRRIEYITNEDFLDLSDNPGFLNTSSSGFNRSTYESTQIGGFRITNSSGVVYHFSLPVYAFDEHIYTENIKRGKGHSFNHYKKPGEYAYTWLLTAVTGPDFVDNGIIGQLDDEDWGYWVEFDYGMWTNKYTWRTPSTGFNKDLDNNFQSFSTGKKEIYYLDQIRTKTHTALFVKEIRNDAKGIVRSVPDVVFAQSGSVSDVDEGGFLPNVVTTNCVKTKCGAPPFGCSFGNENVNKSNLTHSDFPTATLALKEIYLFQNEDAPSVTSLKSQGSGYYFDYTYSWIVTQSEFSDPPYDCLNNSDYYSSDHLENNIIDVNDVSSIDMSKLVRSFDFNFDYSLAPKTANSFSNEFYSNVLPPSNSGDHELQGKLTLKSLRSKGKGGVEVIPPTRFEYDLDQDEYVTTSFSCSGGGIIPIDLCPSGMLWDYEANPGDLLKLTTTDNVYTGYFSYHVAQDPSSNHSFITFIGGDHIPHDSDVKVWLTKNPPFTEDLKDIWGFYKADFVNTENNNLDRLTTQLSVKNVDVWSLREVANPMGSKILIEYESDTYDGVSYGESFPYLLKNITLNGTILSGEPENFMVLPSGSQYKLKILGTKSESVGVDDQDNPIFSNVGSYVIKDANLTSQSNSSVAFQIIGGNGGLSGLDIKQVNLQVKLVGNKYGGGVRVKSISLLNPSLDDISSTNYDYSIPSNSDITSGSTSYEPIIMDPAYKNLSEADRIKVAQASIDHTFGEILSYSRFIPGPGVNYEYVTVTESNEGIDLPAKSLFNFQTFDKDMIKIEQESSFSAGAYRKRFTTNNPSLYGETYKEIETNGVSIKSFSSGVGILKSVSLLGLNDVLISKTENNYLFDSNNPYFGTTYENRIANYGNLGVIEESFSNARLTRTNTDEFKLIGVISNVTSYPNVKVSEKNTNYLSGFSTAVYNAKFDSRSGSPLMIVSRTASDKYILNEIEPAFRNYPDMKNPNMLEQISSNLTFSIDTPSEIAIDANADIINPDLLELEKMGLVSAHTDTWTNTFKRLVPGGNLPITSSINDTWIKEASYNWIGEEDEDYWNADGTYKLNNFSRFNYALGASNELGWQKTSEITLYDVNSHALEATDINGNYAATRFDIENHTVFSTAANAQYEEYIYSGAEDDPVNDRFGGGIRMNDGDRTSLKSHTGRYALSLEESNTDCFLFDPQEIAGRTYLMSVWSDQGDNVGLRLSTAGSSNLEVTTLPTKQSGDWYLHRALVKVPFGGAITQIGVGVGVLSVQSVVLDDFRFQPIDAAVTAYAYNEWGELSEVLDNNNLFTRYEYDDMGRLKRVWKETFDHGVVKVSEGAINYSN